MTKKKMTLKVTEDNEDAYLYLLDHPGKGTFNVVKKQVSLADLLEDYKGPSIYLDFDEENKLIGIEVSY